MVNCQRSILWFVSASSLSTDFLPDAVALVKLFASSKEEISRFCTKLSITPDQTLDLRKPITTVTESYYDLAEMQGLGKSKREEKLSVAKSDERLVFADVDDESW